MFKLGDRVSWVNPTRKASTNKSYSGTVIEVVEKGKRPNPSQYPARIKGRATGVRDYESYLIRGDDGKNYWPLTFRLKGEVKPAAATPAPISAPAATQTGEQTETREVTTNPDGSVTTKITKTVTNGQSTLTTISIRTEAAAPQPSTPQQNLETDFVILLDSSGSMQSIAAPALRALGEQINSIKESANRLKMQMPRVSLVTFGNSRYVPQFWRVPADKVNPNIHYTTSGNTPLVKTTHDIVTLLMKDPGLNGPNNAIVFNVITDGEDTEGDYPGNPTPAVVTAANKTDRWTMAFMVPRGSKASFLRSWGKLGISSDNVMEWDTTVKGTGVASAANAIAATNYMTARSTGASRVQNYYVQPDLSKVTAADLAKLQDLSGIYRLYTVDQEARIDEFIKGKTGSEYVIGSGFYQLTKHEKVVQATKGILLRDKFTKKIYGGDIARTLIGLPIGVNATVDPGNHGNFDIFVESTSINRRLPRGSLVLHDFRMTTPKAPTWVATPTTGNTTATVP